VSDLLFAVLAGFAIMPAVFAVGIQPNAGPGLVFETLPFIFSKMGMTLHWVSGVTAILFFITILVAALTSSISMMEVGVAYLVEEKHFTRFKATALIFLCTWLTGILCSLSFGPLSDVHILGNSIFDCLDKLCSDYLLPFGGLLFSLFVGWKMPKPEVRDEFTNGESLRGNRRWFPLMYFLIKYAAPIGVVTVFATNLLTK
jgi:NSS family neurotransmitter:Na+ symporter